MEVGALVNFQHRTYNDISKKISEDNLETREDKKFSNAKEFNKYLQDNFSSVKAGVTSISSKYLRECLGDDEKQKKLLDNLNTADEIFKNAEKGENVLVKIEKGLSLS